jgi:hypothetical protein
LYILFSDDLIILGPILLLDWKPNSLEKTSCRHHRPTFISSSRVEQISPILSTEHLLRPTWPNKPSGDTISRIFSPLGFGKVYIVPSAHVFSPFYGRQIAGLAARNRGATNNCEYLHIAGYNTASLSAQKSRPLKIWSVYWLRTYCLFCGWIVPPRTRSGICRSGVDWWLCRNKADIAGCRHFRVSLSSIFRNWGFASFVLDGVWAG